jgi:hypothetical protein
VTLVRSALRGARRLASVNPLGDQNASPNGSKQPKRITKGGMIGGRPLTWTFVKG